MMAELCCATLGMPGQLQWNKFRIKHHDALSGICFIVIKEEGWALAEEGLDESCDFLVHRSNFGRMPCPAQAVSVRGKRTQARWVKVHCLNHWASVFVTNICAFVYWLIWQCQTAVTVCVRIMFTDLTVLEIKVDFFVDITSCTWSIFKCSRCCSYS